MKFLNRPLKQWNITQHFGENAACIDLATGTKTIFCDGLNPPTGYKSVYSQMKGHNAVDLNATDGTSVFSAHDGIVEEMVDDPALGRGLGIVSTKKFTTTEGGNSFIKTRYWHLKSFNVKQGDVVKAGQLIAFADNTGYSSGSHLHFELKPVTYVLKKERIVSLTNILQTNGYFGAINPLPYVMDDVLFPFDLELGQRSEYVKTLQESLIKLGFPISEVTGFFGQETLSAVKLFQKKYEKSVLFTLGLKTPTGYVGKSTRAQLEALLKG